MAMPSRGRMLGSMPKSSARPADGPPPRRRFIRCPRCEAEESSSPVLLLWLRREDALHELGERANRLRRAVALGDLGERGRPHSTLVIEQDFARVNAAEPEPTERAHLLPPVVLDAPF